MTKTELRRLISQARADLASVSWRLDAIRAPRGSDIGPWLDTVGQERVRDRLARLAQYASGACGCLETEFDRDYFPAEPPEQED